MTIHRSRRWVLPFLTSAILCSLAASASADVRMPTHVACVGDSITEGFGTTDAPTQSYPARLQGLFGPQVSVKNFGRSGTTMLSQGFGDNPYENTGDYPNAQNFVKGAGAKAVVDVIIMFGANDSKPQNWTPPGKPKNDQQYLKDYRVMVETFLALTPKPLVFLVLPTATGNMPCCSINGTIIHDEEIPLIRQLAAEKSLPIIDLNTPTTGHPEYFGDGVHPTIAGYMVVAKLMHDGLLQDLASIGSVDAGVDGAADSRGSAGDASVADVRDAADSAGGGAGGNVGTGGAGTVAGSGGAGGSAGAPGVGDGGRSDSANVDSGQVGSGGSSSAGNGKGVSSGGCSVSDSGEQGVLASLVSLFVLLSLIGWRRRSERRAPSC